jgi:endo-1,4-beta-xylanase
MKWDTTEPSNGTFNFGPGDQIVSYAKANNEQVRCHNLVWQSQLPSWVSSLPASQVQSVMETHITTEVSHYKGECYAWDVVNEPFTLPVLPVACPVRRSGVPGSVTGGRRGWRAAVRRGRR